MIPRPPADGPGLATTPDDTPMGSSTALTFVKPKRDRTKAHPAASVNKSSTDEPPDATPLAERINSNKPHTFVSPQSPFPVPGTYGSQTRALPVDPVAHRAFHYRGRGRKLAEDIRPRTPERRRLGSSFRPIGRLRLDVTNLQRARSPMLPPPVPASATRQPQSADASDSIINHEFSAEPVILTEDSGENTLPNQNEEQNVSQICWSDRVYIL